MHILSPETDNCPSWISGRERMTVENISWSISTKECCRPRRGLNPRPPGLQSDGASNWATEAGTQVCTYTVCNNVHVSYNIRLLYLYLWIYSHVDIFYMSLRAPFDIRKRSNIHQYQFNKNILSVIFTLRKQVYLNILKILPPKKWKCSDKNSDIFSIFCSKHKLWVLVRTASARRF